MRSIDSKGLVRLATAGLILVSVLSSGCTTAGILVGAAGIATDSSVTWEVIKHVHAKLTEGDDVPCVKLNTVQRALNERCGGYEPGSLRAADIRDPQLQECALAVVTRDPRFWPMLPELLDKGAQPETCRRSPLVDLAQRDACPDFDAAAPAVRQALAWLARADARAIHHDVVRMLSCPNSRLAGLDAVLDRWLAAGELDPGAVSFGVLGALHPDALDTPLGRALEARGHSARAALGGYDGVQPSGFEAALRGSHWAALDWWLQRVPELVNRVPSAQGGQLPWVPLARVLVPSFLIHPQSQSQMVAFLLMRGADPWQRLPFDPSRSVAQYARDLHSAQADLLDRPAQAPSTIVATTARPPL
jgi:hypothetical protein